MKNKRILTVQDISCLGQCSLTVALPILSVCGLETAVLPTAVLSTHTGGFQGYTFRDLSEDIPRIREHWYREGIAFQGFYTGYLGSTGQIAQVRELLNTLGTRDAVKIVDPAMGDNGVLYPAFDQDYVRAMASLCAEADIILPNITEACFLTGMPYQEDPEESYVLALLEKLRSLGAKTVVLTGVGYQPGQTGVAVYQGSELRYYFHGLLSRRCHGTGDVFASCFTGALLRGRSVYDAAKIAADFTVRCIENTMDDPEHWYGVRFEPVLRDLPEMLEK